MIRQLSAQYLTVDDRASASSASLECRSLRDEEMFCDWAEGKRGQILQQRHDRHHGQQESNEQRAVSRHGPRGGLRPLFRGQRSRYSENRDCMGEATEETREPCRDIVPKRVGAKPCE